MKKAKNINEAALIQKSYEDQPHAFIEWVGVDVRIFVFCKCGHPFLVARKSAFHFQCPKCQTNLRCNPNIELIELEEAPKDFTVYTIPEKFSL